MCRDNRFRLARRRIRKQFTPRVDKCVNIIMKTKSIHCTFCFTFVDHCKREKRNNNSFRNANCIFFKKRKRRRRRTSSGAMNSEYFLPSIGRNESKFFVLDALPFSASTPETIRELTYLLENVSPAPAHRSHERNPENFSRRNFYRAFQISCD